MDEANNKENDDQFPVDGTDDILADHEIPHISKRKITYSTIKSSPFMSQRTLLLLASRLFAQSFLSPMSVLLTQKLRGEAN
jgi:hypothetical protein